MTALAPSSNELERFRTSVGERLGLWLDDAKLSELGGLLARRVAARKLSLTDYLALLDNSVQGGDERRALALELTVTETFFFRQADQISALLDHVAGQSAPIRVLSLGCASGEEPYSIAIALREHAAHLAAGATIRAADINASMVERARAGKYSAWALRETPEAIAQRWFRRDAAGSFMLASEIREAVTFQERNLIEANLDLLTPATYNAVFFRNVMMYFTPRAATDMIARIARSLVPGGVLFLGYAETLRGLSTAFHLRHSRETFYYQKRDGSAVDAQPHNPRVWGAPPSEQQAGGVPWYEAIENASQRIRKLTDDQAAAPSAVVPRAVVPNPRVERSTADAPARPPTFDLDATFELLRKERYGDALDEMQSLPNTATHDPDVLLLRCALLVHSGDLKAARITCTTLLERDELNAGAHYLLALICEGERDLSGAADHNRIAAYLDPAFAMPRLHLGLLARRSGDALAARRELRHAYALIAREDTARLVLFAGGFERAALLALCHAELVGCGGAL